MINIVALTNKGWQLSKSVRGNATAGWNVIYFLSRLGGKTTFDKICSYCFSGDVSMAKRTVTELKLQGIVSGD